MRISRKSTASNAGFTLIEIIVAIVLSAVVGVILFTYMGTQLTRSSDPVNIARAEGAAEMWMERIISDYVREMNNPGSFAGALETIRARDYTATGYDMPPGVTLTRTYVTFDAGGNEVTVTGGGTSTNLKVTIQAGGYALTSILTAQRVTGGEPFIYY